MNNKWKNYSVKRVLGLVHTPLTQGQLTALQLEKHIPDVTVILYPYQIHSLQKLDSMHPHFL